MGKPARPLTDPGLRASLSRRAWLSFLLAIVLLGGLSGWYAVQDYRNTEQELRRLLQQNAEMLARSLARSSRFAIEAYGPLQGEMARHLLAAGRFIAHLDREKQLNPGLLSALADTLELFRIHLFDRDGRRIMTNSPECEDREENTRKRAREIAPILEGIVPSLVLGLRESPSGQGKRFAAAVARTGGGAVVVSVTGQQLDQYLQNAGLGKVLGQLAEIPSVAFIAIQDQDGPIGSTPGVGPLTPVTEDPLLLEVMTKGLPASRFTHFRGEEVLEEIIRADLAEGYRAIFRVGIRTAVYRNALQRSAGHGLLMGILFLAAGATLTGLLFLWQHHRFFRSRHLKELAISGRIIATMDEAVLMADRAGLVLRANPTAVRLLGTAVGSFLPEAIRPLAAKDCGGEPSTRPPALEQSRPETPAPLLADRPDPVVRHEGRVFLRHCQPLPPELAEDAVGREGESARLIFLRDITEIRAMEAEVERQGRLAGLGRVASSVAHEIRNPLNAISLSVQTLQRRLAGSIEQRDLAVIEVVREEINRLNRLVEDLLVYSRIAPEKFQDVPVIPLVEHVRTVLADVTTLRGAELSLVVDLEWPDPVVRGNEERLFQVLLNLVRNSLEAAEGPVRVTVRLHADNGRLALTVADSGPGFSPEALSHAMEPFFTTKRQGVGLGLALSAEIVRAHGGRMKLGNAPGGGAEVTVLLPFLPPPAVT